MDDAKLSVQPRPEQQRAEHQRAARERASPRLALPAVEDLSDEALEALVDCYDLVRVVAERARRTRSGGANAGRAPGEERDAV